MAKDRVNITISVDAKNLLLRYGQENHISGGLSGVIEFIAWHNLNFAFDWSKNLEENNGL